MVAKFPKRRFLSVAAFSAVVAPAVASRSQESEDIDPELMLQEIEGIHRDFLFDASNEISEGDPPSLVSLNVPIQELELRGVLAERDGAALRAIIERIFLADSLESALEAFNGFANEIQDELNALARAIIQLIRESFEVATELFSGLEWSILLRMIAHDIRGAFDGAVAGAELGRRLGATSALRMAIALALGGALASSTIGYFDEQRR